MITNKKFIVSVVSSFLLFLFFIGVDFCVAQQPAPTIINYTYDSSGQRITVSNGTKTTVYPTKNYNVESNTQNLLPKVTKHIFANGTDVATIEGSGATAKVYYNHTDTLNSSSVITDSAGAIAETMDYFPFGGIRIDNKVGTFNEQRKYIGQEFDADTGLSYLNARYYNPIIGRFISQDPMFWSFDSTWLADPQNQNSYSYARNNPIVGSDPTGLKLEEMSRPVFDVKGNTIGIHTFFKATPDHPNEIHINGLPQGTKEFTFAAYPSDNNWWSNKLLKQIGTPENSGDKEYAFEGGKIINQTTIKPPEGQSDTQFINNMGSAYSNMNLKEVRYWGLGNIPGLYDANSNNFNYTLGVNSGVKSQMDSFDPGPNIPKKIGEYGYGRTIPTTSVYRTVRDTAYTVKNKIGQFIVSLRDKK